MTPRTELEITGGRLSVTIPAVIDTGFDGDLCLPVEVAVSLGLELVGEDAVELADGTRKRELVFKAKARLIDRTYDAEVFLTESQDALVGTHLLRECRLSIDFPRERVALAHVPRRR